MLAMLIPPKKGRKISYTYSPAGFASITTISFSELGNPGNLSIGLETREPRQGEIRLGKSARRLGRPRLTVITQHLSLQRDLGNTLTSPRL